MTTKEKIKVLQAYDEGKPIQWKSKVDNHMEWEDMTPLMEFNFATADYRIKPEPKVRPYTFEEMCEAVKKHGSWLVLQGIRGSWSFDFFDETAVSLSDNREHGYQELAEKWYWLDDNSPCGVVEE